MRQVFVHASRRRRAGWLTAIASVVAIAGCATRSEFRHPYRPPTVDASATLRAAWPESDGRERLLAALDRSLAWFADDASTRLYPVQSVTHERAHASTYALRRLVEESRTRDDLVRRVQREFHLLESVGDGAVSDDPARPVLFTAYYAPEFCGSRVRTDEFRHPLYAPPDDLMINPDTGATLGRRTPSGEVEPYPTRSEIESSDLLRGREIAWLRDAVDAYVIHVNGSGRVRLRDGSFMNVGHAATNGRAYTSIGRLLIDAGEIPVEEISLQAIRAYFESHPAEFDDYADRNDRYVFFEVLPDDAWPRGSLGVTLTPMTSIATDTSVFPPGAPAVIDTTVPARGGGSLEPLVRLVVDQDSGGAIRGPGRVDLFMGVGEEAGERAGRQIAPGRLAYLLLKPERVDVWLERVRERR